MSAHSGDMNHSTVAGQERECAAQALAAMRDSFTDLTRQLAMLCCIDGKLDAARLDRAQLACYELAFARAELLAAEISLDAAVGGSGELDGRLGLTFVVEAVDSVRMRLGQVALDVGRGEALAAEPVGMPRLRQSFLSGQALDETGRQVMDHDGELGSVDLTGDLAMAQQQFRRFAADVVAPVAESIHREDLTVPESLLEPLREMGVFGLSIPQRFGGIAPDERDDNLMMIVVTEALSEASLAAAGSLITRPEILARALLTGGTDEQKATWLPKVAAGEPLCAIAITEPDFGSDVASLQLKATPAPGG